MQSQPKLSQSQPDKYSKGHPWYYTSIDSSIDISSRKLLEEYSRIPAEEVDSHIYKMRDLLWSQVPYPCIGQFRFLDLNLPKHPAYQQILSLLLERHDPPRDPPQLLDIGCCVAQELRSLTHAGIPSQNLYGSDLNPSYLSTSYSLFKDEDVFQATLVPADIFSPTLFETSFAQWEGKFTVIHAGLFLHLFTWEQQLLVCLNVVKLLKTNNLAMFVGEMVGREGGGEHGEENGMKFWWKENKRRLWLHDDKTFKMMWEEVEAQTKTAGMWRVEASFIKRKSDSQWEHKGGAFFVGEGMGWLTFSVERI